MSSEVVRRPFDLRRDRTLESFDPVFDDIRITIGGGIHPSAEDAASVDEVIVLVAAFLPVALEYHFLEPLHPTNVLEGTP